MDFDVQLDAMGRTELSLEIDATLLQDAQARGVDLADAFEHGIRLALARKPPDLALGRGAPLDYPDQLPGDVEAQAMRWAEENAATVEAYRRRIAEFGAFAEDLPRW